MIAAMIGMPRPPSSRRLAVWGVAGEEAPAPSSTPGRAAPALVTALGGLGRGGEAAAVADLHAEPAVLDLHGHEDAARVARRTVLDGIRERLRGGERQLPRRLAVEPELVRSIAHDRSCLPS